MVLKMMVANWKLETHKLESRFTLCNIGNREVNHIRLFFVADKFTTEAAAEEKLLSTLRYCRNNQMTENRYFQLK